MASSATSRILTLDIVRGVAVMGILAMNIYAFSMPQGAYFNPTAYGGDSGLNLATWYLDFVLVDGKMRGLFSMLFGASTLLVIERAQASQQKPFVTHYSRMIWLFAFGMAHYWFIWWGDILGMYAMAGLFLFLWRNASAKTLRNWAFAILAIMTAMSVFWITSMTATLSDPSTLSPERAAGLDAMRVFMGNDISGLPAEIARMKGDYAGIMDHRFVDQRWKMIGLSAQGLPGTIGIMLIGMWLFRNGFLTGDWDRDRYRKVMLWCLTIGFIGSALLGAHQIRSGFTFESMMVGMTSNMLFQVIAGVGWAALIIWLAKGHLGGALVARIAAAGRMAFTNYLGTSIVMTTIFYGYGGNLFGQFDRFGVNIFVLMMWGLILLWSKPWLERFHYGPLEWLWRSLARFKPQPMLKAAA